MPMIILNNEDLEKVKNNIETYETKYRVNDYKRIMEKARKKDIDSGFRKLFVDFYAVRKENEWREMYFDAMSEYLMYDICPDFSEVLEKIKDSTDEERVSYEASYASKLIATIDDSRPIYDKWVRYALLIGDFDVDTKNRKKYRIAVYNKIVNFYEKSMYAPIRKQLIQLYNETVKNHEEISDVKKLDFVLWGMGQAGMFIPCEF